MLIKGKEKMLRTGRVCQSYFLQSINKNVKLYELMSYEEIIFWIQHSLYKYQLTNTIRIPIIQ